MQRLVLGFVLGLVIGVTAGWMLGAVEPAGRPERPVANRSRDTSSPQETTRDAPAADGRPTGRRVRVDPRANRQERRTRRAPADAGPAPSAPAGPATAPPKVAPSPEEGSAEAALAELTAIAFGTGDNVSNELVNRVVQADLVVPWETVLALAARGFGRVPEQLLDTWPEDMLRLALDLATDDGHPDAEALRDLGYSAAAVLIRRATPTDAQVAALASHHDPRLRKAAALLAYATDPPQFDRLLSMAREDASDVVRTEALEMVAVVATEHGDPALLERALPALEHAARHGSLDLRRTAIESLPDAGPGAAAVALELFQEEGVEPDLLSALAAAAASGGRLAELLAGARTDERRQAVAEALTDDLELPRDVVRRHARAIAALAAGATPDGAYDLYWLLRDAGAHGAVATAAANTRVPGAARRGAFDVLLEDEEPAVLEAGLDAARAVLLGGAGGVGLRRHVVERLGEWDWTSFDDRLATSVRAMLAAVAAKDSNSWVRGVAAEVLAEWE